MLAALGWARTVFFAALVLALPAAAAWVVHRVFGIESVSQAAVALSAGASVVLVWLRAASATVAKIDAAFATVATAYNDKIRADPKVKQAELDLAASNAAAEVASESLAATQEALQQAQADLDAMALPAQMMSLISSRMKDRSYTRELTTVSTARGDLQLLSRVLREQAAAGSRGAPAGVTPVERVVLYVDDLDRCRPEDVVKVLQVVHMLLAFELFVVVVAVDARWVDESLKQTYHWLTPEKAKAGGPIRAARTDPGEADPATAAPAQAAANTEGIETSPPSGAAEVGRITPQDYLEKIFQISFWLEPMNASRAAEYLKSLVRTPHRESGGAVPLGSQVQAGRIEVMPIELDYMRALAAYVGPSPRRVKRLVNAYRLLKARLSDAQLDQFLTDRTAKEGTAKETVRSGPYQLVIGLLVIGTGAPNSASEILTELAQRDPGHRLDQVIKDFRVRNHPDWTTAAQILEMLMRTQKTDDISELRGWASKVGRFLLQGSNTVLRQRSGPI